VKYIKGILDQVGIGGDRLEMYNMSSAEGPRFAQVVQEMTERIKALGPSPARRDGKEGGNAL
jgi:coenzyme F420-reducing hydrogenase delta subunit